MAKMTYDTLETLGRERLSESFYMREFLYSEIANWHQLRNVPEFPNMRFGPVVDFARNCSSRCSSDSAESTSAPGIVHLRSMRSVIGTTSIAPATKKTTPNTSGTTPTLLGIMVQRPVLLFLI